MFHHNLTTNNKQVVLQSGKVEPSLQEKGHGSCEVGHESFCRGRCNFVRVMVNLTHSWLDDGAKHLDG